MRKPAIGVFVIDDQEIVRTAFAGVFSRDSRLKLVGTASGFAEATESIPKAKPDVVVAEVLLPGFDGLEFGVRFRYEASELLAVWGGYRYLDYEDDTPYLYDTSGEVSFYSLGLAWTF